MSGGGGGGGCNAAAFGKTICSICYEDLNPVVEDLQCVFICGHVFHELCLQQWLEYCPEKKKKTCPVCKQRCGHENIVRLYFQSIGDSNDSSVLSQKPVDVGEDDPAALRRQVKKLQAKISGLGPALERREQESKALNEDLCVYKEQVKKEAALKDEALQQRASVQQLLRSKTEELVKTSSECFKLQERNMALAKELAALKLVSDLNLDGEEVVKLASFGHETNSKDTVDILKKSLVLRNKSYKELMSQCNLLGRGETRSVQKLEKAKEKIKKLKARVQELELAFEEKENKALRALKVSKRKYDMVTDANGVERNSNIQRLNKDFGGQAEPTLSSDQTKLSLIMSRMEKSDCLHDWDKKQNSINVDPTDIDLAKRSRLSSDRTVSEGSQHIQENSSPYVKSRDTDLAKDIFLQRSSIQKQTVPSGISGVISMNGQSNAVGLSVSTTGTDNVVNNVAVDAIVEDVIHINSPSSDTEAQPLLHIRKDNLSSMPTFDTGDRCFAGGLLGPDGVNRYLGKWCKRAQAKASTPTLSTVQGSNASSGDLISVGPDGRGGTIKVLRSQCHSDSKGDSIVAKRCKNGSKQSNHQTRGFLQIEHFFGKVDR
ncbi:hypothetical protein Syun_013259 [Stephania yunnanensis]|uniref:RING-type domain-containing protein n=1 Tax=Stephania yunnanensis TaxID=152371 RepID=A0AAP0PIE9_9MAGN